MPFDPDPIFNLMQGAPSTEWKRPSNWLPLSVTAGQQKVQILLAVSTDMSSDVNRNIALSFVVTGGYTVNWGDGSANENFASAAVAKHTFNPAVLTDLKSGWKQVLITVTPQTAANITQVNLNQSFYVGKTTRATVIEVVCGSPTITSFMCSGSNQMMVEHIQFLSEVTLSNLTISTSPELRAVEGSIRWNSTTMMNMFSGCTKLTKCPTFTQIQTVTVFSSCFAGCFYLTEFPTLDTSNATSLDLMFYDCRSMKQVPSWLNTLKATNISSMFMYCYSVESMTLDLPLVTSTSQAFMGMYSLRSITLTRCFNALTTGSATALFQDCRLLESINGTLNFSGFTSVSQMFNNLGMLRWITFGPGQGPKVSFQMPAAQLDAATLNAIYTSLPTVTGQTITVTNNPGTLGDDPTIATAKGWTVSGS